MRIVLIVSDFPKISETFIVNKFVSLLERGHDVHVVCQRSERKEWDRFPQLKRKPEWQRRVHVDWPIKSKSASLILLPLLLLRRLAQAPLTICRYLVSGWRFFGIAVLKHFYVDSNVVVLEPDILHFEFGTLAVDRMYLKTLLGCSVITSFRGYDINSVGLEDDSYYLPVWREADALHFLGQDLLMRARRRGCPADAPVKLIPPSVDTDFFRPLGQKGATRFSGSLRLLSVGRLDWKKGYEFALSAVRRLVDEGLDVEYRIIGSGEALPVVAFCRHQLGLEKTVMLLGASEPKAIRQEMEEADVFLHAAVSEGFCNAVLEAQAMELPVVTTDAGGLSENVLDGVTGFVVPRREPNRLAEKILVLASDPDLRLRMGRAGRQRVLQKFQLQQQIAAFEALYAGVYFKTSLTGAPLPEELVAGNTGTRS